MTFATLRSLLDREITELDRTVALCRARLKRRLEFVRTGAEDILADSLAACLHFFYSGLENILETIASELDEISHGPQWHKRLLYVMTLDVPGVRPPVLSEHSYALLDEFRAFRHMFRNLYTHSLKPDRVFGLAQTLDTAWDHIRGDLVTFIAVLGEIDAGKRS